MTVFPLQQFLRMSCLVFFSTLINSCITTRSAAIVGTNSNVSTQQVDSLPLIPKSFLEQEALSHGNCLVRGKNGNKVVALTFDDGPTELTNDILAILDKHCAKATFFWLGKNLSNKVDIIKKAKENGHLIANHSWDHTNGTNLNNSELWENQVWRTFVELKKFGIQSNYYRPPFGGITQEQIDFLGNKDIKTVLWSITTMDWDKTQNDYKDIAGKFKLYLHKGAIVLLHDYDFGKSDQKLKALEKIIEYGKSQGYSFVTIENIE